MPKCKYAKLRKQVSFDGGTTWQNTDEYATGALIEYNSSSCTQRIEYTTTGGTTVQIPCTSTTYTSSAITQSEVRSNSSYTAMTDVTVGGCVSSIGSSAFTNCGMLEHIKVDEGITTIAASAFRYNFSLKTVDLPSTLTSIGNYAFQIPTGTSQTQIYSFTIRAAVPPVISSSTLVINNPAGIPFRIYVPAASVNTYKGASYWSNFASYITAIPT